MVRVGRDLKDHQLLALEGDTHLAAESHLMSWKRYSARGLEEAEVKSILLSSSQHTAYSVICGRLADPWKRVREVPEQCHKKTLLFLPSGECPPTAPMNSIIWCFTVWLVG